MLSSAPSPLTAGETEATEGSRPSCPRSPSRCHADKTPNFSLNRCTAQLILPGPGLRQVPRPGCDGGWGPGTSIFVGGVINRTRKARKESGAAKGVPKPNPPRLRKCRAGNTSRVGSASLRSRAQAGARTGAPAHLVVSLPRGAGPARVRGRLRLGTAVLHLISQRGWAPAKPHQLKARNKGKGDGANRGVRGGQLFGGVISRGIGAGVALHLSCVPQE